MDAHEYLFELLLQVGQQFFQQEFALRGAQVMYSARLSGTASPDRHQQHLAALGDAEELAAFFSSRFFTAGGSGLPASPFSSAVASRSWRIGEQVIHR